jgi:hypothetical protein
MQLLRFLRRHPIALLAVITVAFVTWIWWDALPKQVDPTAADGPPTGAARRLPRPALIDVADDLSLPSDAGPMLAKLKPGMPRAEVEKLVGPPAHNVSPATIVDGRVTYHTAYEADFGPAPTVRPIHPGPRLPTPAAPQAAAREPAGRMLVTLEFDATKPGHPLVEVHYADPLF